jgi:hypothetical protein
MHPIDREGSFRGTITDYGLYEASAPSKALGVNITAHLKEIWNPESQEWENWEQYELEASGTLYIIKKDGDVNTKQVETLVSLAKWDGDLESVINRTWDPPQLQFSIAGEDHKGKRRYRISWLNDFNRTPGGGSNVSADDIGRLKNSIGGKLRAVASAIKKVPNAGPANGARPQLPPPRQAAPIAPPVSAVAANGEHDGTIPF